MKALRRSLKNDKSHDSRPSHQSKPSLQHKTATAIIPPKKVIKALYDYVPADKNSEELAFHKGDFFHVISREDDAEWYEACNPLIPSAKGLVPVAFFEVIGKQQRQSGQSVGSATGHDSGFSEKGLTAGLSEKPRASTESPTATKPIAMHSRGPSSARAGAMVYGHVLYNFQAERPDELDAKSGEAIIVVAQSNPEWFVAKPIGRLGGPGLIPVSFVQIRDTSTGEAVTDPVAAVKAAGVPRVEEWKKTAAEYKNSSISLGQINTPQIGGVQQIPRGVHHSAQGQRQQPQMQQIRHQPQSYQPQSAQPKSDDLLAPIKASVPRYCFDNDTYWYIIEAQMSDGRWWELSRYYADFYDFQIALLEKFPDEAGNTGKPRSLPFMPGPVAHVTDAISNGRRQNLDEYIKKIVSLPQHIREDELVKTLFAPKPNQDYEIDPDAVDDDYRYSGHSLAQTQSRQSSGTGSSLQNSAHVGMPPPPGMRNMNGIHQNKQSQTHGPAGIGMLPQPLHSQNSNLTTNSAGTSTSAKPANTDGCPIPGLELVGTLRIKVEFKDEILALRLQPKEVTFNTLKEKVIVRLQNNGVRDVTMKYRDDPSGTVKDLKSDDDLKDAIQRNVNVRLVVSEVK